MLIKHFFFFFIYVCMYFFRTHVFLLSISEGHFKMHSGHFRHFLSVSGRQKLITGHESTKGFICLKMTSNLCTLMDTFILFAMSLLGTSATEIRFRGLVYR